MAVQSNESYWGDTAQMSTNFNNSSAYLRRLNPETIHEQLYNRQSLVAPYPVRHDTDRSKEKATNSSSEPSDSERLRRKITSFYSNRSTNALYNRTKSNLVEHNEAKLLE